MMQDPFSDEIFYLTIPELGAEGREVTLVNWLVPQGERVIAGERIAELLVASVLFHLEASRDGRLSAYLVPTGSTVSTGQRIAVINPVEEAGEQD